MRKFALVLFVFFGNLGLSLANNQVLANQFRDQDTAITHTAVIDTIKVANVVDTADISDIVDTVIVDTVKTIAPIDSVKTIIPNDSLLPCLEGRLNYLTNEIASVNPADIISINNSIVVAMTNDGKLFYFFQKQSGCYIGSLILLDNGNYKIYFPGLYSRKGRKISGMP